ncbi:MAG: lipopolysaccharide biosynthesis protein [Planctomycetota bacterium]|nr:MAG: lipopolysaccharide biosynthesis protein [Planctomycetota bacterium]
MVLCPRVGHEGHQSLLAVCVGETPMTFVMFIEILVDSGMTMAIVQRKDLDPRDLDSIFWLNIGLSLLLTLAGFLSADLLSVVVENPEVALIFAALSPIVFIKGLTVVQMGLAQRDFRFKVLAVRGGAAAAVGGVVGIACAISGLGLWSIVAQNLATAVIALALLWRLGSWRPTLRFEWQRAASFFRFASGVLNSQIAVFFSNSIDILVVGAFFGEAALGVFRLALRIVNMAVDVFVRPIQVLAVSQLAALQHDPPMLRQAALQVLRISTTIMFPAMAALAVSAELIGALLGDEWRDAESAVRILIFIGLAKSITLLSGPMMLALGRSHAVAFGSWVVCGVTATSVIAAGILARGQEPSAQVDAMAWARSAAFALAVTPVQLFFMTRSAGLPLRSLLKAMWPAFVLGALTLLGGISAQLVARAFDASPTVRGVVAALASVLVAAVVIVRERRAVRNERTLSSSPETEGDAHQRESQGGDSQDSLN